MATKPRPFLSLAWRLVPAVVPLSLIIGPAERDAVQRPALIQPEWQQQVAVEAFGAALASGVDQDALRPWAVPAIPGDHDFGAVGKLADLLCG